MITASVMKELIAVFTFSFHKRISGDDLSNISHTLYRIIETYVV